MINIHSFYDQNTCRWIAQHVVKDYTFECFGDSKEDAEAKMRDILLNCGGDPVVHEEAKERGDILRDLLDRGLELPTDEDY